MIRVLGDVMIDGGDERSPGQTYKRLIAVLAAEANSSVSAESLMEALWYGEKSPPKTARNSFRNFCSRLRKALDAHKSELIADTQHGLNSRYTLSVVSGELDYLDFQKTLERSERLERAGEHARAAEQIEEGLALWRGTAFGDVDVPRVAPLRQQLEEQRVSAIERLGELYYRAGRYDACVHLLGAPGRAHPERERLAAIRMKALHRTGRSRDAINVFQETRQALDDSGLLVSAELNELERAILNQDDAMIDLGGSDGRHPRRRGPFVGRDDLVSEVLESAAESASFFLVTGEPGMGKSRLMAEVHHAALDHRIAVVAGRPGDDYPTPLDTFDQVFGRLLEIATETEELEAEYAALRAAPRLTRAAGGVRERLPGLVRQLDRMQFIGFDRVLIVIDDAHAIDELSLFALREWARSERHTISFLVLARPAPAESGWGQFLAEASAIPESRARALRPLTEEQVAEWLRSLEVRHAVAPDSLAASLCQHGHGNPYLIGHLIHDVNRRSVTDAPLRPLGQPWLPEDLAPVVRSRLLQLPAPHRRFLAAAAVVGTRFLATEVASVAREVLGEELMSTTPSDAAGLVLGPDSSGYHHFDHDLTRVAARDLLTSDELKRLHAGVLRMLEQRKRPSWELASHACAAVPLIEPGAALRVARSAADELFAQSSFAAAAGFYHACIDLVPDDDVGTSRDELRVQRARAMQHLGLRSEALIELDAVVERRLGDAPELAAAAAIAAAEFADVVDWDDPTESLIRRALSGAISDAGLRTRLLLELRIVRSIRGLDPHTSDETTGSTDAADDEYGTNVAWLHEASGSANATERLEVATRLNDLASREGRDDLRCDLVLFRLAALAELGAGPELRQARADFKMAVDADPRPIKEWHQLVLDASVLQDGGNLEAGNEAATRALEFGTEIDNPDAAANFAAHMLVNGILTATFDDSGWGLDGEPSVDAPPALVSGDALLFAASDNSRAAAFVASALAGLDANRPSTLTPAVLAFLSEAVVVLEDTDAAEELVVWLAQYRDLVLRVGLLGSTLGPAAYHRGRLLRVLGDRDRAVEELRAGAIRSHSAGLPVWEARSLLELASIDAFAVERGRANNVASLVADRSPALSDLADRLRSAAASNSGCRRSRS